MKAAIIYWSKTKNTEKVAYAIKEALEESGVKVLIERTEHAKNINFFDYDINNLTCLLNRRLLIFKQLRPACPY